MNSQERPTYDPDDDVYRTRYKWSRDTPPSVAVVETVSTIIEVDPFELDTLDVLVESDSLDTLLMPAVTKEAMPLEVEFTYEGCHVSVSRTGLVEVDQPDD